MGNKPSRRPPAHPASTAAPSCDNEAVPYKPSGVYRSSKWFLDQAERVVVAGLIAPRVRGEDERLDPSLEECPICLLHYERETLNTTRCCGADICSECFLSTQVRSL
jgi:hypothetical protein